MYFQQHGVHEKGLEEHYPTSSGFWTTSQISQQHRVAPGFPSFSMRARLVAL